MRADLKTIIIAALLLVLISREGCHCLGKNREDKRIAKLKKELAECNGRGPGVVVKRDTFYLPADSFRIVKVPQPYKVEVLKPYKVLVPDTQWVYKNLGASPDTADIVTDYMTRKFYADSLKNQYGTFYIYDTLQFNEFAGRGVSLNFVNRVVTETVRVPAKLRRSVWFGLTAQAGGAPDSLGQRPLLRGFGIAGAYQNRRSTHFQGSVLLDTGPGAQVSRGTPLLYQGTVLWKFSFRRQ